MWSNISLNKLALSGERDVHYDLALRLKGKKASKQSLECGFPFRERLPCHVRHVRVCVSMCVAASKRREVVLLRKVALRTSELGNKERTRTSKFTYK